MTGADVDPRDVLALLLHELGSPLGAAENHLHLAEPSDAVVAARGSLARSRAVLARGRRWLEASVLPLAPEPLDPLLVLQEAWADLAADRRALLRLSTGPSAPVQATRSALHLLFREVLERATGSGSAARAVSARAEPTSDGAVRVVLAVGTHAAAPRPAGSLARIAALRTARAGGHADVALAVVETLLARQGGTAEIAEDAAGTTLALRLPAAARVGTRIGGAPA